MNSSQLGTITLQQPSIALTMRPDGSNWEDLVSELTSQEPENDTGSPLSIKLRIEDGRVTVQQEGSGKAHALEKLNAEFTLASSMLTGQLDCSSGTIPESHLQLEIHLGDDSSLIRKGVIKLDSKQMPVGIALPFLARNGMPLDELSGDLNGNALVGWDGAGRCEAKAKLQVDTFLLKSTC